MPVTGLVAALLQTRQAHASAGLCPQVTSARQGAELLGQLVSQHGAGEAFGVLFADAREAWCAFSLFMGGRKGSCLGGWMRTQLHLLMSRACCPSLLPPLPLLPLH